MNNYGLIMKDIGLHEAIQRFALLYLAPIASHVFPDWVDRDDVIDSLHAFTVDYRIGEDVSLPVSSREIDNLKMHDCPETCYGSVCGHALELI